MSEQLPIPQKYLLTMKEAQEYFGLGVKTIRRIAENHMGTLAVFNGNRVMIIRHKFEEYILNGFNSSDKGNEDESEFE